MILVKTKGTRITAQSVLILIMKIQPGTRSKRKRERKLKRRKPKKRRKRSTLCILAGRIELRDGILKKIIRRSR